MGLPPKLLSVLCLLAVAPAVGAATPSSRAAVGDAPELPGAEDVGAILSGASALQRQATNDPEFPQWYIAPDERRASSVGAPNDGHLEDGVPLPPSGPGFRRVDRDTHYGTDETVALLTYVGARLRAAFPKSAPMLIGDLSKKRGGKVRHHRSHRSGRDVDIGFFEKSNVKRRYFNGKITPGEIDIPKSWFVIETLLLSGRVEFIFVDKRLLAPLDKQARSVGWTDEDLDGLFLMPGESGYRGVLRHAAGHLNHFHVRFRCPEGDEACETY